MNAIPAALAAAAFAPTASKRRPTTVRFTTNATAAVTPIAISTVVGTSSTELVANACSAGVVSRGVPPEIARTPPNSSAFMPRVVTIGITPIRLTVRPVAVPAPTATASATSSAAASLPESPLGRCVTMTTVIDMTPGTERSIPPCWMTSV